jgi:hypothetical protein
MFSIEH